jgi:hypothetical protein
MLEGYKVRTPKIQSGLERSKPCRTEREGVSRGTARPDAEVHYPPPSPAQPLSLRNAAVHTAERQLTRNAPTSRDSSAAVCASS